MPTQNLPLYASQAIVALLAVIWLVGRQLRAKPVKNQLGFLPLILVILALQPPGPAEASVGGIAILIASVAISIGMGYWRAMTTRLWRDQQGLIWNQGTLLTATLWGVTVGMRLVLEFGLASLLDIRSHPGGIWLALAVTLGVQRAVILLRARRMAPPMTSGELRSAL